MASGLVSHKGRVAPGLRKGLPPCVGRPELGEIATGKAGRSFALFKLDELRFSGHGDPIAALVLCGRASRRPCHGGQDNGPSSTAPFQAWTFADLIRRHSAAARQMQAG